MTRIIDGRAYRTFSIYEWSPGDQRWIGRLEQSGWLDCCGVLGDSPARNVGRFFVTDDATGDDLTERAINEVESWPVAR